MELYNPGLLVPQMIHMADWKEKSSFKYARECSPLWIIFIIAAGSFRFRIGEREGVAGSDDLLLCPPDTPFEREMLEPSTFLAANFNWYAPDGSLIRSHRQLTPDPSGKFMIRDMHRLSSTHAHLVRIADRIDPFGQSRRNVLLQDLWQVYAWEQDCIQDERQRGRRDALMKQAERAMRDQGMRPFNMKALSRECGLSPVQFTRRFKAAYGVTPTDYLTAIRLERVRTLLLETELTLDEIAAECGYESGNYLSRVFSRKMKISPSMYRQGHRL